jgi:hypothetical protein
VDFQVEASTQYKCAVECAGRCVTNDRPALSSEMTRHDDSHCNGQTKT